jgi:hypothetical protein
MLIVPLALYLNEHIFTPMDNLFKWLVPQGILKYNFYVIMSFALYVLIIKPSAQICIIIKCW